MAGESGTASTDPLSLSVICLVHNFKIAQDQIALFNCCVCICGIGRRWTHHTHKKLSITMDHELVKAASDTLQVHEKLRHLMNERLKDDPQAKQGIDTQ